MRTAAACPGHVVYLALAFLGVGVASPPIAADEEPDTIVITAPAPESPLSPDTIVVSAERARQGGARTVADAIASVPGVTIQRSGSRFEPSFVRIRGSSTEQVAVLVDGRSVTDDYSGIVDLSRIPLDRVERIEITRGPGNAIVGGGAAGVINIVLAGKSPGPGWSGDASYRFGSFGEHRASAATRYDGAHATIGAMVGGVFSQNRYDFQSDGDTVSRENAGGADGYARVDLDTLDRDAIVETDAGVVVESASRGVPGSIEFPSRSATLEDTRAAAHIDLRYRYSDETAITVGGSGGRLLRTFSDRDYPLGELESETRLDRIAASAAFSWSSDRLGVDLETDAGSSRLSDLELGRRDRTRSSIATTIEYRVPGRRSDEVAAVALSGRGELVDEQFLPSARGSLVVSPWEPLRIGIVVGAGYRLPTFLELFQPVGAFVVGNPDLVEERSVSAEGSVAVDVTDRTELSIVAYAVEYRDLIQWVAGPDGRWSPRNSGRARVTGVELLGGAQIPVGASPWTATVDGSFEVTSALSLDRGVTYRKQLPYRERSSAGIEIGATHAFGHSVRLDSRIVGARPVNAQNTVWLDPYVAIDAALRARLPVGGVRDWFASLTVTNLVGTPYVETRFYPNPGREIVVGTEVSW
jgi:outer membrane cobalamin receptor